MRYYSKSLEIKVVVSGNVLLFKGIKISLGLLITARKMHTLFRESRYLEVSTTANNGIRVPVHGCQTQNSKQILVLSILLNKNSLLYAHLVNPVPEDGILYVFSHPNCHHRFDNVSPNDKINNHTVRLLHETL